MRHYVVNERVRQMSDSGREEPDTVCDGFGSIEERLGACESR